MRKSLVASAAFLAITALGVATPACGDATVEAGPPFGYPSGTIDGGSTDPSSPKKPYEKPPPPAGVFDWRDAVLYFAFVDRFADGDPSNNCNVQNVENPGQYKGGDWKGVTK